MKHIEEDPRYQREEHRAMAMTLLLFVTLAVLALCMVGCKSTKSTVETEKVSVSADTLVAENRVDTSVVEYRAKYDSLVRQTTESFGTVAASQVKDSTYVGRYNNEWVHVHDSMDVKVDTLTGRISYYYWNTKESRYVTHDTIYKERTRTDSTAIQHSLLAIKERYSTQIDSLTAIINQYERLMHSHSDSLYNSTSEEKVVTKTSWWEEIKAALITLLVIAIIAAGSIGVVRLMARSENR